MERKIPLKLLELLTPINELSSDSLQQLIAKTELVEMTTGNRISEPDEDEWLTYVVKGTLYLASNSGAVDKIEASSQRAKIPVFCESCIAKVAVFRAPGILLRIDKKQFLDLQKQERSHGIELSESSSGETETTIFQLIYSAYEDQSLELPAFPEVAFKIKKMLDDPDTGIHDLIQIINTDPSIAGRLIKISNSVMYRGVRDFETVRDAVVRLGLSITSQVVSSIALAEAFKSRSDAASQKMHALWEHSLKISALSYIIAKTQKHLDPERALLAGLIHDIGEVPILNFAGNFKRAVNAEEIEHAIQGLKDMVGILVINSWEMGTEMATVVAESEKWRRETGSNKADYCDCVVMAQIMDGCAPIEALPPLEEIPVAQRLNLVSDEKIEALMDANQDTIDELTSILF